MQTFAGGIVDSVPGENQIRLTEAHGLTAGQGITYGGELRFVTAVIDSYTVEINAPLSLSPLHGSPVGPTITYKLGKNPKSVSLFDYWSPDSALQRILAGSTVDELALRVNGDFHEFDFRGFASELVDNSSFAEGQGQLTDFPVEPVLADFSYAPIPGHLGQVWLGATPQRFYTLTEAELTLSNNIDARVREFGSGAGRCFVPGPREVRLKFSIYEQDNAPTMALYQAAKSRTPIQVMLQLGQQGAQLCGFYVKSFVPEIPEFDDGEAKLRWKFPKGFAQGTNDDELYICFG